MSIIDVSALDKSLKSLLDSMDILHKQNFPKTRYAVRAAAGFIEDYWISCASGHPIAGTSKTVRNTEYAKSITTTQLSDFKVVIGSNNKALHEKIVSGIPRRDMKQKLPTYDKRRTNKQGEPYLIVPFRHRLKNLAKATTVVGGIRKTVASIVTKLKASKVVAMEGDGSQRVYDWRGRLQDDDPSIYTGLVRFDTSTGSSTSSAYLTFRVMSVNSPPDSWIHPGVAGVPITQLVYEHTKQDALRIIQTGIIEDFKTIGIVR